MGKKALDLLKNHMTPRDLVNFVAACLEKKAHRLQWKDLDEEMLQLAEEKHEIRSVKDKDALVGLVLETVWDTKMNRLERQKASHASKRPATP